jgi:hypothetical protein
VQQIPRMGIRIRPLTLTLVAASEAIRVQEGLITNDYRRKERRGPQKTWVYDTFHPSSLSPRLQIVLDLY